MTRRATVLALLLALTVLPLALPVSAQGQSNATNGIAIPVVGSGSGLAFAGTFNLERFVARDGVVSAVGTLTGTLTTATGIVTSIVRNVALPVTVGRFRP